MNGQYLLNYANYIELDSVLTDMELILTEQRIKHRDRDFSEQIRRIETLQKFKQKWIETMEENKVLNDLVFKVTKNFHLMDEKIHKLEQENTNLKKDIIL